MHPVWWRQRRWLAFGVYVALVFGTVPLTRQVGLALRNTDLLGATVTGSYAIAVAGVVYYVLFNRRLADWMAFAVVAGLLCVVTVLLLGLSIPEERVHFLQYGAMALLARSALARGTDGAAHPARVLLLGVTLTSTLGFLEECLQGLVPRRVFDWRDVAMNGGAAFTTLLLDELLHDRLGLRRGERTRGGAQ
jgi:hypothetical protein